MCAECGIGSATTMYLPTVNRLAAILGMLTLGFLLVSLAAAELDLDARHALAQGLDLGLDRLARGFVLRRAQPLGGGIPVGYETLPFLSPRLTLVQELRSVGMKEKIVKLQAAWYHTRFAARMKISVIS